MLVNVCPSALCTDGTPEIPALIASFVVPAMERGARTDGRACNSGPGTERQMSLVEGKNDRSQRGGVTLD